MNKLDIFSHDGTYELFFNIPENKLQSVFDNTKAIIIDKNILELYSNKFNFDRNKTIIIEAEEHKKTPEVALSICEELMKKELKRKDKIVAIGGGITQDLVTFASSILFRGIKWTWIPTTLLAQADSCIGGKSSLNYKSWKNIIGNFYPPAEIIVQDSFLDTLKNEDIRSGIGEILKVHMLSGKESTELLIKQLNNYTNNPTILSAMIFNSLKLKNKILEIDPLDQGLRLKMNYGHSFGHALEAATNFGIPHGIAVTIGLDIANYIALKTNKLSNKEFEILHNTIIKNLENADFVEFNFNDFIEALKKDKKNDSYNYNFIIPISFGEVELTPFSINEQTNKLIYSYFDKFYLGNIYD